jgi:very-short-patch-repair endonuclease
MPESQAAWMTRLDDLLTFLAARGGIAPFTVVVEQGFARRTVESGVAGGVITRPRRGWIASKDADRQLVAAARFGVVLTCRTQASRLGLWLHDHRGRPHFAVPPHSARKLPVDAKLHWGRPPLPRHPDALADPVENVLAHIAVCEPFEQALATWESALHTGLVTVESLRGLTWKPVARRILLRATPFADAGLETYVRERLRWLKLPIRVQIWIAGHRVDTLIGDRLILQIDGAHHTGSQRSEDIRHDAELMLMGYRVIRVSYPQVMFDWASVQDLIMRAVAQGHHLAR